MPPYDYLNGGTDGIDLDYYNGRFDRKLQMDYRLAQDCDFYDRYVNGYDFPAVPRFRQDTRSWNEFVQSWCESVALEAAKKATRSLLTRAVIAAATQSEIDWEPEPDQIRDWLRKSWNTPFKMDGETTTVGEYVMDYYSAI